MDEISETLESHRRQIRLHCYRMTGSLHDADDLAQEALVRAWQNLGSFRGESTLATWLYRIATNACLDFLRGKKNRVLPWGPEFPRYQGGALPEALPEAVWLEPYPTPEDQALRREHVSLAFLTLLQHLPPNQRAAVILTEVLDYSAREAAELLDSTPAAVNSALQRARQARGPGLAPVPDPRGREELLARFLAAWEAGDAAALVALMRDDATMVMPPIPLWVQGRADILRVLVDYPFRGDRHRWRLVPTPGANGGPAFGFYALAEAGVYRPWGIQALVLGAGPGEGRAEVTEYHVFKGAHLVARFGLPEFLKAGDQSPGGETS